jgi:hypothetical protein
MWQARRCPPVLDVANNQSIYALLGQFVEELEDGEAFDVPLWAPGQLRQAGHLGSSDTITRSLETVDKLQPDVACSARIVEDIGTYESPNLYRHR